MDDLSKYLCTLYTLQWNRNFLCKQKEKKKIGTYVKKFWNFVKGKRKCIHIWRQIYSCLTFLTYLSTYPISSFLAFDIRYYFKTFFTTKNVDDQNLLLSKCHFQKIFGNWEIIQSLNQLSIGFSSHHLFFGLWQSLKVNFRKQILAVM